MNFDIKVVAGVVSLLVCFAGIASTWTLLQYRIDQLEKKNAILEADIEKLSDEFRLAGEEVRCLICKSHEITCPGC
tara:strand:+ start:7263 stop:7490 length:228 start_codon:yes stop_codon:yes gene_type:complete